LTEEIAKSTTEMVSVNEAIGNAFDSGLEKVSELGSKDLTETEVVTSFNSILSTFKTLVLASLKKDWKKTVAKVLAKAAVYVGLTALAVLVPVVGVPILAIATVL
jgi:hypothetical protein